MYAVIYTVCFIQRQVLPSEIPETSFNTSYTYSDFWDFFFFFFVLHHFLSNAVECIVYKYTNTNNLTGWQSPGALGALKKWFYLFIAA